MLRIQIFTQPHSDPISAETLPQNYFRYQFHHRSNIRIELFPSHRLSASKSIDSFRWNRPHSLQAHRFWKRPTNRKRSLGHNQMVVKYSFEEELDAKKKKLICLINYLKAIFPFRYVFCGEGRHRAVICVVVYAQLSAQYARNVSENSGEVPSWHCWQSFECEPPVRR